MRTLLCFTAHFALLPVVSAQDARYQELTSKAFALYEQKDYKGSAATYSSAFEVLGWTGQSNDRYNAACSWALAGMPDSAFFQLERIVWKMDYVNLTHITTDTDLNSLHADARWHPLIEQVKANKERVEANYDKPLVALLDTIYELPLCVRGHVLLHQGCLGVQKMPTAALSHSRTSSATGPCIPQPCGTFAGHQGFVVPKTRAVMFWYATGDRAVLSVARTAQPPQDLTGQWLFAQMRPEVMSWYMTGSHSFSRTKT